MDWVNFQRKLHEAQALFVGVCSDNELKVDILYRTAAENNVWEWCQDLRVYQAHGIFGCFLARPGVCQLGLHQNEKTITLKHGEIRAYWIHTEV